MAVPIKPTLINRFAIFGKFTASPASFAITRAFSSFTGRNSIDSKTRNRRKDTVETDPEFVLISVSLFSSPPLFLSFVPVLIHSPSAEYRVETRVILLTAAKNAKQFSKHPPDVRGPGV